MIPPISSLTSGADFKISGLSAEDTTMAAPSGASGGSFGSMLANQIGALAGQQESAAAASRSLADGTASDPSSAVMAVEKAQLSMQLASQLRTKGVEAMTDLMHTTV